MPSLHTSPAVYAGLPLREAQAALILVHGRGAGAADILSLAPELSLEGFALIAPQASQNTWYPFSFLAPTAQNEPGLSDGLARIGSLAQEALDAGIAEERIFFLGFSQGACLSVEYAARQARRYGGVFVLSGGLIGDRLEPGRYAGDFGGTPVFMGCSDPDSHIPRARVEESAALLRQMGAAVDLRIYPQMGHTIIKDEVDAVNRLLSPGR
jgi:phospholipase/carboxylesterase